MERSVWPEVVAVVATAACVALAIRGWPTVDDSSTHQLWAAWLQAGGGILAVAVAIFVSAKQAAETRRAVRQAHELAIGAKRGAVRAVVDAAVQRMREIRSVLDELDGDIHPRPKLHLVYHSSVIHTMTDALNAAPLYEIGSANAVQALLRFKDQFAFFGVALQKYYEGPNADHHFRRTRDEIDDSYPDWRRLRREMTSMWDDAHVRNVFVHTKAMEEHYEAFVHALQE